MRQKLIFTTTPLPPVAIAVPSDERRRSITLEERPVDAGSDSSEKFHFSVPDDALVSEDHGYVLVALLVTLL